MSRTIVIGDVHGCADELAELLERIGPTRGDRVLFVGDLVIRGPHPARVLALVRDLGAEAVRGNHEDRLLRWRRRASDRAGGGGNGPHGLRATAAALGEEDWAQLAALPLWRRAEPLLVVHAALDPRRPVEEQDERTLMYGRTIDAEGNVSERRDDGEPWGRRYMGPEHVVFGHNAQSEPQLHPWATGIDTGCVYGGALTALVLPRGGLPPPPAERLGALVSVPARRIYHPI